MQYCKIIFSIFFVFIFSIAHNVFAQSYSTPEVRAPEVSMPTVTAPSMGGSFYRPQVPGRNSNNSSSNTTGNSTGDASPNTNTGAQNMPLLNLLSGAENENDAINPLYNISADAISKLGDVYGSKLLNSTGSSASFDTNTMLNMILTRLQALEDENATLKNAQSQTVASKAPFSRDNDTIVPAILRFTINGANILSSCKTVYFSHPEENGTFLLSGDRRVVVDGRSQTETFYILFNAVRDSKTGRTSFETALTVSGGVSGTLMERFADYGTATATLTGNLVALHINENDLRVDLLIDKGTK